MQTIDVYLEVGAKRTFAGGLDWPGWCRNGRDSDSALQALLDSGQRYAQTLALEGIPFQPPADVSALVVVEQLPGNETTNFGAPDLAPAADARPFDEAELERSQALMRACWQALERAAQAAQGKELRKGPRGGGRDLEDVIQHVLDAQRGYLYRLAWNLPKDWPDEEGADLQRKIERLRQAVVDGLENAAHGGLPEKGPRGGTIWQPRYFVRRSAWHILDHAWELEDRIL